MSLTYLRQQYLNDLEDHYNEHGHYPDKLKTYVNEPEFKVALKSRNLPLPKPGQANGLDSIQRAVIRTIADYHDKRPIRAKLKDFEVTSQTYQSWLKSPTFKLALEKAVDRNLSNTSLDTRLALSQLILDKDLNAIKYYNEITGIYRPNSESTFNLTIIVSKMMDILVKHLTPETLSTVADELEVVFSLSFNPEPQTQTNNYSSLVARSIETGSD